MIILAINKKEHSKITLSSKVMMEYHFLISELNELSTLSRLRLSQTAELELNSTGNCQRLKKISLADLLTFDLYWQN